MVNQLLLSELRKNEKDHKIFEYQRQKDLQELEEYIKNIPFEITISITQKDWYYPSLVIYSEEDRSDQIKACRKYLTAKILKELEKQYESLKKYEIQKQSDIFEKKEKNTYQQMKNKMYSIQELIEILSIEDIPIERIHVIITVKSSELLCDSLTVLLGDNLPFSTSVYLTQNNFYTIRIPEEEHTLLWQAYRYKRFRDQELRISTKDVEKDKR